MEINAIVGPVQKLEHKVVRGICGMLSGPGTLDRGVRFMATLASSGVIVGSTADATGGGGNGDAG